MANTEHGLDKAYELRRFEQQIAAGALGCLLAALITYVSLTSVPATPEMMAVEAGLTEIEPITVFPDFASIDTVAVKKQQFFDFLEDYVMAENANIAETRRELRSYVDIANSGVAFSQRERRWILQLAEHYDLDTSALSDREIANELYLRVDKVPVSLALAQAANESAWGTSRFARQGNNIFGQWCYEEGCGLVPRSRLSGATHEVKKFDSIQESVNAYINNINTHPSYSYLRELRARMRDRNRPLDSLRLATGLGSYSQRGDNYVDEVQNLIVQNQLTERDKG
ncbi:MAG: glucosaminidase domain-containing protein [Pseudomonadales bacterium]|nr:glucosaminidase domain-containing protein [Pseudomonadales bacterium]MBL6816007.1 glucosaminidase domain-containing protein [Pseudomonadales bacterium]